MSEKTEKYKVLFIDDDKDILNQFEEMLNKSNNIENTYKLIGYYKNFENGLECIKKFNYDIIVCDFLNNENSGIDGERMIKEIRELLFCPIIMFTNDPTKMYNKEEKEKYAEKPFITFLDKSEVNKPDNYIKEIARLIGTRLPYAMQEFNNNIRNDINKNYAEYTWGYLEKNWNKLKCKFMHNDKFETSKLEKIIRQRMANKILAESVSNVTAFDYYLVPIVDEQLKLGSIIEYSNEHKKSENENNTTKIGIILTPHCYLETHGNSRPKVDKFLLAYCMEWADVGDDKKECIKPGDGVRKAIQIPIPLPAFTPIGRYCFLPELSGEFDNLLCDLSDVKSMPIFEDSKAKNNELKKITYKIVARLLPPYAEALQSAFVRHYASVGTPPLDPKDFMDLGKDKSKK